MRSLKWRAIDLRKRGWSYNVITKRLGVSKSTLSGWLRMVPYEPNQAIIARIRNGPAKAAATKSRIRLGEINGLRTEALEQIGTISRRDLWLLGLGLYLGEGSKLYESVRIINSDPLIIKLSVRWLQEVCEVPRRNHVVAVHLYPDISLEAAERYWSRVTGIPRKQFEKSQVDRRNNKSFKKKRRLPYGTAHIRVRSMGERRFGVTLHRRIMGWIDAVHQRLRV